MGTTAEKLTYLNETKTAIKTAIVNKGVEVSDTDTFRSYASKIDSISAGGNTLKTLLDATKSCYHLFFNFKETSVDGLISYSDTSNVTNMSSMFQSCSRLTTIPLLDTSNVTNMDYMFNGCSNLTTIPQLDTSKVTSMGAMFVYCSRLTTIPQLDTSKVTSMGYMFQSCSSLTTIPQLDTSNVTNMGSMFQSCSSLTTIPQLDTSKVTRMNSMFQSCSNLKSILMYGMKVSFNISYSTKFEQSDLVTILNNLATVTSSQTLTMGSTNLAKLTDEDKAIATNKGWTLA